jgi:hypothetical protein
MVIQINPVFSLGTASFAQLAAYQTGIPASPIAGCSWFYQGNEFVTAVSQFRAMTNGFYTPGPTGLLLNREKPAKSDDLLATPTAKAGYRQEAYGPNWVRIIAAAALCACAGCASSTLGPSGIGHTSFPKTDITSSAGIMFKAHAPLRTYEEGKFLCGTSAADTTIRGFTINADSGVCLDQKTGRITSARPNQDIMIPIDPILEKIHQSIFEGLILNYELDVLREGVREKMTVKEIIERIKRLGGTINIPAGSIMVSFDKDGEIDEAQFLVDKVSISEGLEVLVTSATINIAEKLTPFFPKGDQKVQSS